jgi:hypothetical protein
MRCTVSIDYRRGCIGKSLGLDDNYVCEVDYKNLHNSPLLVSVGERERNNLCILSVILINVTQSGAAV